jgi:hypothetical protein
MDQIRAITINDQTYNVAQASAVSQKKLMLLIGSRVAFNSAAGGVEKIDQPMLVGTLLALTEETFDQVASIVLYKTVIAGTTTKVDIGAFQGGMLSFMQLVAAAIAFNLDDFFTWLDSENSARRAAKVNEAQ